MCEECRNYFCPPGCPGFSGELPGYGYPEAVCEVCGCGIYHGEVLYYKGNVVICKECAEGLDIEGFRELCGKESIESLLISGGFQKVTAGFSGR